MLLGSFYKDKIEAGCDEAGRGCLAGPVFAAAVILPDDFRDEILDDSKKLNEKQRYALREIIEKEAVSWAVASVDATEIDDLNILNASFLAMHRAIDKLTLEPEHLLIDGNRFNPYKDIPFHTIIKGDGKYLSIAAASIMAKTYRDDFMKKIHREFPVYAWDRNKGYPTREHKNAIRQHGYSPYHRRSFNASIQLKFDF
jgi:ribonuclease HII